MGSQEAFEIDIVYESVDVIFSMLLEAMALIINVFRCCDAPAVFDLWDDTQVIALVQQTVQTFRI